MRSPILLLAALANLSLLSWATPIEAPDFDLIARATTCTNYPSDAAGSTISKRSENPANSLFERASNVNWCRQSSNYWIQFQYPQGGRTGSQTTFGDLFTNALNALTAKQNAGQGNSYIPGDETHAYAVGSYGGFTLYAYQSVYHGMTYSSLKTFVQILQNYVYVTKRYEDLTAIGNWVGGSQVGNMQIA